MKDDDASDDPSAELADMLTAEAEDRQTSPTVVDPRDLPVRFSRLKQMARSPAHYWQACQYEDDDDSLARRLGSGAHALIFRQPYAVFSGKVRRGKVWDAFKAANAGVPILNEREHRKARSIAEAIQRNPLAMHLLFGDDARIEQHLSWSWIGRACSSRPDSSCALRVTDLKSTVSAEPSEFTRQALRMHYHAQVWFYMEAERALGRDPREGYLVAVEATPPHPVTCFKLTPEALEAGEKLCRSWMERLLVCESSNVWPEYTSIVMPLEVPLDDDGFRLVVAGEEITF